MTSATQSIIDTRREQMFPTLQPLEIERVHRFGEVRSFRVGELLAKVGEGGRGLSIILAGQVEVTRYDQSGRRAKRDAIGDATPSAVPGMPANGMGFALLR